MSEQARLPEMPSAVGAALSALCTWLVSLMIADEQCKWETDM